MSYIVNRTDGNIAAVVNNGVLDTTTSLKLVGKGYPDYAETIAEDLVALLENFSSPLAPTSPLPGQLWYNNTLGKLKVFDGDTFRFVNNVNSSDSSPTNPQDGDFWYNTTLQQLFFYKSTAWRLIAPLYTAQQTRTELVVETFKDASDANHIALVLYVDAVRIAVISQDTVYDTFPAIQGFPTIHPGINIANNGLITDALVNGTATRSLIAAGLETIADATYMHANSDTSTVGNLTVSNQNFVLGTGANLAISANITNSITSVSDSKLSLNGYGGAKIVLDNATNWIAVNKTSPSYDLDVGGTINSDESIRSQQGYFFADNSNITSTSNNITISAGGVLQTMMLMNTGDVSVAMELSADSVTTTNDITVGGNAYVATVPTQDTQVANKDYVDSVVLNNALPIGTIVMWYGAATAVPSGWAICNGLNGTPDLRDKFVIGAGTGVALAQTGGSSFVSLQTNTAGSHFHVGTSDPGGDHNHGGSTGGHSLTAGEIAGHTHTFDDLYGLRDDANPPVYDRFGNRLQNYTGWGNDGDNDSGAPIFRAWQTDSAGNSDPHSHTLSNSSTHTHTITINANGAHYHEFSFDNRPAFLGLWYIMRVANILNPYT